MSQDTAGVIPAELAGLVDDAAVFPPGDLPLAEALSAHRAHRAAPYAALVGPLVLGDRHLALIPPSPSLAVAVVVSGGAGALEPAVRWAATAGVKLRGLEIAVRDSATGELAHNARRVVAAVDDLVASGQLADDVPVHVEPPRLYGGPPTPDWFAALDVLAARELRLKWRTGGEDADAFPSPHELAGCIEAALDRETPFKCTAGLHHAVRHRDQQTGFEHHGFLNVLLATTTLWDGGSVDDAAQVLAEQRSDALVASATPAALGTARRWFSSFGSCSVLEPLEDLRGLGLVESSS